MELTQATFFLIAGGIVATAVGVVTLRNIFHAALLLIACFGGVAALYVLLEAPFLAGVQVLIYIGAISVLILFGIMLTERVMQPEQTARNEQWWLVLIVMALLASALAFLLASAPWPISDQPLVPDQIAGLGVDFLTTYVLPFEVASLLLLMALLGAVIIARERGPEEMEMEKRPAGDPAERAP